MSSRLRLSRVLPAPERPVITNGPLNAVSAAVTAIALRHQVDVLEKAALVLDPALRQQALADRAQHGLAVNLDPSSLILDMVLKINETAAAILARH